MSWNPVAKTLSAPRKFFRANANARHKAVRNALLTEVPDVGTSQTLAKLMAQNDVVGD